MPTLTLPAPNQVKEMTDTLRGIATENFKKRVLSSAESTLYLRGLHHVNFPVYQAAFKQWGEDFLEVCDEFDSSGIWKQVTTYAQKELTAFSFAEHSDEIEKGLNLNRFIKEWKVPKEKYTRLWPYITNGVSLLQTRQYIENCKN